MSDGVAKKKDPEKWEAAKRKAKAKMGGKHSARAMQLATKYYKDAGGRYEGKKPTSKTNRLKKWGEEKWQTREEYEKRKKAKSAAKKYRDSK